MAHAGSGLWSRSGVTVIQGNSVDNRSIYQAGINQSIACIKGTALTSQKLGEKEGVQVAAVLLTKGGFIAAPLRERLSAALRSTE